MAVPDRMNAREDPRRKVLRLDEIGRPHGDGVLNGILEFTDIAWPVVSTKHRFCFAGDTQHGSARPASELRNEGPRQRWNVLRPFAERRCSDGNDIQPEIQVLAKAAVGDGLRQVAIGSGNESDIQPDRFRAAESFDLSFFDRAEQLGLKGDIHLADLFR